MAVFFFIVFPCYRLTQSYHHAARGMWSLRPTGRDSRQKGITDNHVIWKRSGKFI